jgi:AraC-like DNA-binding protein
VQIQWLFLSQFVFVAFALVLAGLTLGQSQTRWLGSFFLAIGLHGAFSRMPFAAGTFLDTFSYAIAFAYGPLIYLALRGLLRVERFHFVKILTVIVPMALATILIVIGTVDPATLGFLLTLVQLVFVVAGFRELRQYARVIQQSYSVDMGSTITWVRSALWVYTGFLLLLALRSVLATVAPAEIMASLNLLVSIGIAVTLALLTAKVLRNPSWIPRVTEAEQAMAEELDSAAGEPTSEQLRMAEELNEYLRAHQPFLDAELTVKKLADQLGWTPRQLSEVINRTDRNSFSIKINGLRVIEARRLLSDPARAGRSLLDISMGSGFNSKSTFNLMFKRFADCTPSEYRKNLHK